MVLAVIAFLIIPTPSAAEVPTSPPGAPTGVTATPGSLSATVAWSPSGAAADSYTVTSSPGGITATIDGTATSATVTGLGYLVRYTFTVTGTNSLGTGPTSAPSEAVTPGAPGGPYHQGNSRTLTNSDVTAGGAVKFNIGQDRVHAPGLTAVVLNVTASQTTVPTNVQVVEKDEVEQTVSVRPGEVQSSLVVVPAPAELTQAVVQVTAGTAHVQIDFVGYFTDPRTLRDHTGILTMVAPSPLLDAALASGSTTDVGVLGQGGVPSAHVGEVLLNVTATSPGGTGLLALVPSGSGASGITTLGFAAGESTTNRAIVSVPSNGSISVIDQYAPATVHIDILGWFSDGTDSTAIGGLYSPLPPARLVDTTASGGPVAAGATLNFPVYGQGGAPPVTATAPPTSVIVNITAVAPAGAGSISAAGATVLDFAAGDTASRVSVLHLGNDGSGTLGVSGSPTNVTIDLIGFFAGDLIVPGSTKVLTPQLLAAITKVSDGDDFVTFSPGTQISPFIGLNDVIVAGPSTMTPQGFLLRVLRINTQPDGSVLVSTRDAALSEALTAYSLDGVIVPSSSRFGFRSNRAPALRSQTAGVTVNPCPGPPAITSIDPNCPSLDLTAIVALANALAAGTLPNVEPDGSVHLSPVPWADLALTELEIQVLPHFHIEYNFSNNTAKAFFAWSVGLKFGIELTVTKDLVSFGAVKSFTIMLGQTVWFDIGPIPVSITPTLTVAVTLDSSISAGLRFAYHYDKWSQVTESFDGSAFHTSASEHTYVDGFDPPAFEGNAEARPALHEGPGLTFYRFCIIQPICVNPFTVGVDFSRYVRGTATVTCTPQPSCFPNPWWTLASGACIGVFMKINLFYVFQRYFQVDLKCVEDILLQAPGPHLNVIITPSSATVPRFHVQHFHAVVSNSPSGVSFSVVGGNANGTLSNTLLTTDVDYTAPGTPGDYQLAASAIDDPSSFSVAQIHVPADPPSQPTNVTAALAGFTSVTVSWGAPADNGGEPITDYKVVSSDGTTIDAGTSSSATFNGLTPGATYMFSVYATNSANLTSAAAVSPPVKVPPTTAVTVQPPSVDFGTLSLNQISTPQTVTVFATNVQALTISTLTLSGTRPQDYTIQSDLCSGQVVPAGGNCTFAVVFTASATGPSSASVLISDDDPTSPQSVALKAQVSSSAVVAACILTTIAGGAYHTAVVDPSGKVFTWGRNQFGQLGNGTFTDSNVPVAVSTGTGLPPVAEVSAGASATVVRTTTGTVWAWGDNSFGGLGNTAFPNRSNQPVQVMDAGGTGFLTGVSDVAEGSGSNEFGVAVKSADGSVWTWGYNLQGQLGNGTTTNSPTPVQVKGPGGVGFLTGVVKVAAGTRFVVALKSDGTVWAWGGNFDGELGINSAQLIETTPVQVTGPDGVGFLTGIIAIGSSSIHTLAVRSDGVVFAWGFAAFGQLGNGTPTAAFVRAPVAVSTISGLTNRPSVSTGAQHSLAADPTSGKAWGWGDNAYGQVGDGTEIEADTPSQVVAAASFTEVSGGEFHSVGLGSDGTVWTWGYNFYGQLGNGQSGLAANVNPIPHALSGVTAAQPKAC
jgi:YD repeat-containing protein